MHKNPQLRLFAISTKHNKNPEICIWACLKSTPSTRTKLPTQILEILVNPL